jgi:uncharacterized protein YjbI with pentapeptide repeats
MALRIDPFTWDIFQQVMDRIVECDSNSFDDLHQILSQFWGEQYEQLSELGDEDLNRFERFYRDRFFQELTSRELETEFYDYSEILVLPQVKTEESQYSQYDKSDYSGAYLREANLQGEDALSTFLFDYANLEEANFEGRKISNSRFCNGNLQKASFARTHLINVDFFGCNLNNANFQQAEVMHVNFKKANLSGAVFTGAKLHWNCVDFSESNLYRAKFDDAELDNFVEYIFTGNQGDDSSLDLNCFQGANLEGATFVNARLRRVEFSDCNLTGVDFTKIERLDPDCFTVFFRNADLTNAKFVGANLQEVEFHNCNLKGADFTSAIVDGPHYFRKILEYQGNENIEDARLPQLELQPEPLSIISNDCVNCVTPVDVKEFTGNPWQKPASHVIDEAINLDYQYDLKHTDFGEQSRCKG